MRWTEFKTLTALKLWNIQCDTSVDTYNIFGIDGDTRYECTIWRGEVPWAVALAYSQETNDADKIEFEVSYLPSVNKQIQNTIKLSSGPSPTSVFAPTGFSFVAAKETSTAYVHTFTAKTYLKKAALLVKNAQYGDWLMGELLAPNNAVLLTYIRKLMIFPGQLQSQESADYSPPFPSGYKLRFTYNSITGATEDAIVLMNLINYEG